MRLYFLLLGLLVLGSSPVLAVPTSSQAQAIAGLMQQTFRQCGQGVSISTPLSLAALDILHHSTQDQALTRQHYRIWKVHTFQATYHGDLPWLARSLANRCVYGTDKNDRMARTSKMNMIMHGDGHGGVHHWDGFLESIPDVHA